MLLTLFLLVYPGIIDPPTAYYGRAGNLAVRVPRMGSALGPAPLQQERAPMIPEALRKYVTDLRTLPGDLALAHRHNGWRGAWNALATRTVHRVFRTDRVVIFAQPLDGSPDVAPPPGVCIAPLSEADWPALSRLVAQRDLARFRRLVASGRHGVVAWRGSQPIGYGWVAERIGPDVTACDLALPAHAAYLWDLYVIPSERSSGVGSALASARMRKARELGFSEGWRMISPSNVASLRTLARTGNGTRVIGELRYVKVLSRVHVWFRAHAD